MTEVIVDFGFYSRFELRFREWLYGWLQWNGYNVASTTVMDRDFYTVFEVEGDMFELFEKLYDKVRFVRRYMEADVNVALCSGSECIDMSSGLARIVLSNYAIKKLERIVNKVRCVFGEGEVEGVEVSGGNGTIALVVGGCATKLYIDEALVVAADMVRITVNMFKLEMLDEVKAIYDMFKPEGLDDLNVGFMVGEDGYVHLFINSCSKMLTSGEAMWVSYKLMKVALEQLKAWREEEP
jgi:hypothetical protein